MQDRNTERKSDYEIIEEVSVKLINFIKENLPHVQVDIVEKAIEFAKVAHCNQRRASNDPYVVHPIEVAQIIANLKLDTTSIVVALLHDVIEDTKYTLEDIENNFDATTAQLVAGLTKLHQLEAKSLPVNQGENLRKLLMAVSEDVRVLLVKLADRLHNMRTLHFFQNKQKRFRIAKDTLDIYAPLAERIGIHIFKNELYDLAFSELYTDTRNLILNKISKISEYSLVEVENVARDIIALLKRNNIVADVQGRKKSPFSIWKKMENKNIMFEQLSDIFALRIITETVSDCYLILGLVHTHYHSIPTHFCDYISNPKLNGYRSLHTVISASNSERIEVQIRTKEMHHIAELGIAAHWVYKQYNKDYNDSITDHQYKWLHKIREILEKTKNSGDIINNAKLEMYYDQVFCFTPNGDVIALPRNATTLDFAFEIDVNVGLHYNGALINNKKVGIDTQIQNGDSVQIIVSDKITLCKSWYDAVNTAKAKADIKSYLEKVANQQFISFGRTSLENEFHTCGVKFNEAMLDVIAASLRQNSTHELLRKIGRGIIDPYKAIECVVSNKAYLKIRKKISMLSLYRRHLTVESTTNINDVGDLFNVSYAYCCNPVAGKLVVGIYNDAEHRNLVIHVMSCSKVQKNASRFLIINWTEENIEEKKVNLEVIVKKQSKSVPFIFNTITEQGVSDYNIDTKPVDETTLIIIGFNNIATYRLQSIIDILKSNGNIISVNVI